MCQEGHVYISRDVAFDGTFYPFSKLHPNAGARLREEIYLLSPSVHGGVCLIDDLPLTDASDEHNQNVGEICRNIGEEISEKNGEGTGRNSAKTWTQHQYFMPNKTNKTFEGDTPRESMLDRAPRIVVGGSALYLVRDMPASGGSTPDVIVHTRPITVDHVAESDDVVGQVSTTEAQTTTPLDLLRMLLRLPSTKDVNLFTT
jgi:hypothetical protein